MPSTVRHLKIVNFHVSEFIPLDQLAVDEQLLTGQDQEISRKAKMNGKSETDCLKLRKAPARRSCYKQYTMASMWAALERIEQGLSVYRASLEYGVPRKTLRNWMKKYNILSYFDLRKQERERSDVVVKLE